MGRESLNTDQVSRLLLEALLLLGVRQLLLPVGRLLLQVAPRVHDVLLALVHVTRLVRVALANTASQHATINAELLNLVKVKTGVAKNIESELFD